MFRPCVFGLNKKRVSRRAAKAQRKREFKNLHHKAREEHEGKMDRKRGLTTKFAESTKGIEKVAARWGHLALPWVRGCNVLCEGLGRWVGSDVGENRSRDVDGCG